MKYLSQLSKTGHIKNDIRVLFLLTVCLLAGCKKFVEVPDPITSTSYSSVYTSDAVATSVLTGIYTNLANEAAGSPQLLSISVYGGLSADEFSLINNAGNISYRNYYHNISDNRSATSSTDFWSDSYQYIYVANSAIGALTNNTSLTPAVNKQLMGEAKFMRAFCYFYLVNLYGDVPLVTGISPTINASLPRVPQAQIYQLILTDLKDAESLLSDKYLDGTVLNESAERVRPTKWAASALLARTYLYLKDWANAQKEASLVISNNAVFSLTDLNSVFLKNSQEAIWQLQPVAYGMNTIEGPAFILPSTGVGPNYPITLGSSLFNSFEPGDERLSNWVGSLIPDGTQETYYYPYKYKINTYGAAVGEYEMVLRLGEQYLIRAEAEAELGDLSSAAADLNSIRNRAGLSNTTSITQSTLLTAIQQERRVELFSEWGHRWLDLKRTGTIDAAMSTAAPLKGGTWDTRHQLYPISNYELLNNRNLVQNPGY